VQSGVSVTAKELFTHNKKAFLVSADNIMGLSITLIALSIFTSGMVTGQEYIANSAIHSSKMLYLYAESQKIAVASQDLGIKEFSGMLNAVQVSSGLDIEMINASDAAPAGCGINYVCRSIAVSGGIYILVVKYANETSGIS